MNVVTALRDYYLEDLLNLASYSYGRLGLISISKLAWLPRLSFSHLPEWLLEDPQQRLNSAVSKVVALGTPDNRVLTGNISPLANAIHPLGNFKKSTFTALNIQKITGPTDGTINDAQLSQHKSQAPSLAAIMKTTVITSFFIFLASVCTALFYGDFKAARLLLALGSSCSLTGYMTRWEPIQVDNSRSAVHERKKGDMMIYTSNGALILITCSTEVAEDLYFKFPSFTRGYKSLHAVRQIGFGAMIGIYWAVFSDAKSCSHEGQMIIFWSVIIANLFEVAFGLMPSDWRWDLSQYYWADTSPRMPKNFRGSKGDYPKIAESNLNNEETPEKPRSSLDLKFANMLLLAIVKSKEAGWILNLNLITPRLKIREAKTALKLAPILLNPKKRKQLLDMVNSGKKVTAGEESFTSQYIRHIISSISTAGKAHGRQTPDPSAYHINSRSRELGSVIPDVLKLLLEVFTGRTLSWYPWRDPEDLIAEHHVRVYSLDPENPGTSRFYHDIPKRLAEALFSFPFSSVAGTNLYQWWLLGRPRVFLHGSSIVQILLNYYALDTAEEDSSLADPSSQSKVGGSSMSDGEDAGPAALNSPSADIILPAMASNRGDSKEDVTVSTATPPVQPEEGDETSLFLCADVAVHDSRAHIAKLGANDRATIEKLRRAYRDLSSKWPGVKRITGVRFFRFHSFLQRQVGQDRHLLVHIHKDKQRYPLESDPEYSEYRYSPRPWPGSLPFPAREICWYFLHPQDCGTSSALNEMLPVRIRSELATHRRAFGIYIEERYSVWAIFVPVVVLSSIVLGATLWFIKSHTDDLQTAIVPFTVASSIGTLVVNVAVSLLLFRMLAP